ncbi:alpha,alpha-trehalose-phosphate synthase (UDP-forming) [Natronosalvus vescus]|uniref:alpha,alpha-trehalose-phosphate synthase (UDP-forming) n=1 Tax=Natronosalvus vescus TaxID=2953881 RepID=UPI0020908D4E|nr:trehalose-6-phosphate synthase [Natronosalvus vescus]
MTDGGTSLDVPESVIVVSNRQPYRHEWADDVDRSDGGEPVADDAPVAPNDDRISVDEPTGGLTAGLDPVMQTAGGTWIAWGDGSADRAVVDEDDRVSVPPDGEQQYTLRRVWLSSAAEEGYYLGYSNRVLWPLCHELSDRVEFRPADLEWYQRVNRQFADAILEEANEDSVIWLQDYHLGLVAGMIRSSLPAGSTIAHFWHIPWPSPSEFADCPNGRELLIGLLGTDVLGFHVERYGTKFLACVEEFVPDASVDHRARTVSFEGSRTQITATPMGVDVSSLERRAQAGDVGGESEGEDDRWASFRERYDIPSGCKIGFGIERLDYTKGIPERLAALERLFEAYPSWQESFTFVQKATPSRTSIPAYQCLGEEVRSAVERINDRFATDGWQPIVYTEDYLDHDTLATCYREADLQIVSSLQDGMNLVAQEYVAASVNDRGALVLSSETGAADVLGYPSFTFDPTDTEEFAKTIVDALSTPESEQRTRMAALRAYVTNHDLEWWMDEQLSHITASHRGNSSVKQPNGPFRSA